MKHPFFKSILILGAALALVNCTEESPVATTPNGGDPIATQPNGNNGGLTVLDDCWYMDAGTPMLIYPNGIVTNANGEVIGTFVGTPDNVTIVGGDGVTPIVSGVNLSTLTVLSPNSTQTNPTVPASSAANGNGNAGTVVNPTSSATNVTAKSSSSAKPASSATQQNNNNNNQQQPQQSADGGCYDKPSNKYVKPYDNLNVNGASYAYKEDCTINCYYDPQGKNCASLGSSTNNNNNQQQTQNNNQQQSSSSKPKSSSSQQQQQQQSGNTSGTVSSNYTIKYVAGGKSGSGYASRYWDCCEPHCAWPEHGGKASTCDASGNKVAGGSPSMCDGGNAGICRGQFPIVVNDKMAFAFAATPGGENNCGKCFDLAFTGKGKYATDNHSKLVGKHLIVMSSNVGYDVAGGQFDVMIPGGGYGIFNGCSQKMGWGSQGSQYGGLLDECEKETGYTASKYKSCLTEKCNKSFSMDPQAKEGCLFMANWMEAAGNPLLEYKEVECPKELLDRF